jgi:hypothetical protein
LQVADLDGMILPITRFGLRVEFTTDPNRPCA